MKRMLESIVRVMCCTIGLIVVLIPRSALSTHLSAVEHVRSAAPAVQWRPCQPAVKGNRRCRGGYSIVYSFSGGIDGGYPQTALTAVNGSLYGSTSGGGRYGFGTVFTIGLRGFERGAERVVHSFGNGSDGMYPDAELTNVNGVLYGTTAGGGVYGQGTVFAIDSATGKELVIYSFSRDAGQPSEPESLLYANGVLYGTSEFGGSVVNDDRGQGTIFAVSARGIGRVLHRFGSFSDGAYPENMIAVHGAGYGTTQSGGAFGAGTIYEISDAGTRVRYSFNFNSANVPRSGLLFSNGIFYGTTQYDAAFNPGTVYAFDGSTLRVLYRFGGKPDASFPIADVITLNGSLYGTTLGGGKYDLGTIFKLTAGGAETVLHSFAYDGVDGDFPSSGLLYVDGALYGTTSSGGYADFGVVYKLTL